MNGSSVPGSSSNHSCACLERDGRRERPERLALLDHRVDPVAHLGAAGIGEDAAIAEGARPELHPAPMPRDDLPVGDHRAPRRRTSRPSSRTARPRSGPRTSANADSSDRVVVGAEERDRHAAIADLAPSAAKAQRRAERRPVVAGRGLHVDLVEEPRRRGACPFAVQFSATPPPSPAGASRCAPRTAGRCAGSCGRGTPAATRPRRDARPRSRRLGSRAAIRCSCRKRASARRTRARPGSVFRPRIGIRSEPSSRSSTFSSKNA